MTECRNEAPAELTPEEVAAVAGGNGYFGSGHRDGGSVVGSGG